MYNFLSKILEKNRIIAFVILFSVLFGIIAPQIALAGCLSGAAYGAAAAAGYSWWTSVGLLITVPAGAIIGCTAGWAGGKYVDASVKYVAGGLLVGVGALAAGIIAGLVDLAQRLLDASLDETNFFSYTGFDNPVIASGWVQVRDLANMLIVLGFVIIGIATALRFRDYEAKKLLLPLIIAALLINFSLLICGIFIDGSNILTKSFLQQGGGVARTDMVKSIKDQVGGMTTALYNAPDVSTVIASVSSVVLDGILTFLCLILYAVLFIARHVVLWLLVILSPLAFACYVFPFTKKYFEMWWSNFFGWCIIGIPGAFCLFLSDRVASGLNNASQGFLIFYIPVILLIAGFMITMKSKGIGAGIVMSAFKTGGLGLVGAAVQLSGRTQTGQRSQEWLSNAGAKVSETLGFAPVGHTAQQKAAREADARKQVNALRTSTARGDTQRYERLVQNGRGAMGAAAVATANEQGDLSRLLNPNNDAAGLDRMNQRVGYATQFGHERSEFEKKDYRLAQFNNNRVNNALMAMGHGAAIDRQLRVQGIRNPERATAQQRVEAAATAGLPIDDARRQATMTQLRDNLPQMSTHELGRIDSGDLGAVAAGPGATPAATAAAVARTRANYEFVRENFKPHMIEQLAVSPNRALLAALRSHVRGGQFTADIGRARTAGNMREVDRLQKMVQAINRLPR